jgi:chromosome partitioning protein
MNVIAVVNLKGGSGKTTTAAFMAHALHERGQRVLLVDADKQESAYRWSSYAGGFPMRVERLPTPALHWRLGAVAGDRYDVAVIDTPPIEEHKGVVASALIAATHALVPIAPTPAEIDRVAGVTTALRSAGDLRLSGQPPVMAILLSRTVPGASSTAVWREHLESAGHWVLRVQVGRREHIAQAFGGPITRASVSGFGDAVDELLGKEEMVGG